MPTEHKWWTNYFRNLDEVEYVFGITLYGDQREAILTYLYMGVRPDPKGCWVCDAAAMRKLTSDIDRFEFEVASGAKDWPWPIEEETT